MLRQLTQKNLKISFLLFFLLFIINTANANKPITVVSDTLLYNNKTGIGIYSGNVLATDGDKKLIADKITVFRNKKNIIYKISATGSPAVFFDNSKKNSTASGRARIINYFKLKNLVILEKEATLDNNNNILKAPKIIYNTKTEVAKTIIPENNNNSNEYRTKIVLGNIKN